MLIDARTIRSETNLDADVCIIGAGPAGITMACELMELPIRVVLIESGGEFQTGAAQKLGKGSVIGNYEALEKTRVRALGGTSWSWGTPGSWRPEGGMQSRPLEGIDFEARSWVPNSGWPFGYDHLEPFYERAHRFCNLGPLSYELGPNEPQLGQALPLDPSRVRTALVRYAPRDTFLAKLPLLASSPRVTVLHHATVVEIEPSQSPERVSSVRVRVQGGEFRVGAKLFTLAAGGIENARLLLLSRGAHPQGLGNGNDLVGRFFTDHLVFRRLYVAPHNSDFFNKVEPYRRQPLHGVPVLGTLILNSAVVREEGLLGVTLSPFITNSLFKSDAFHSLATLVHFFRQRQTPPYFLSHLGKVLRSPLIVARTAQVLYTRSDLKKPDFFGLHAYFEQAPQPENRVKLSAKRDEFGLNQAELNWRPGKAEEHSLARTLELMSEQFAKAGLGVIEGRPEAGDFDRFVTGVHHHIGTTRMHADPRHGVVDPDCLVYGTNNLYVAGSSVFPTGGATTITLTIVAMAIRLADHLKHSLRGVDRISA